MALTCLLLSGALCLAGAGRAADKDKDKAKDKEKEKKVEPWVEVRSAHFTVASDGGEKTARRVLDQFDQVRRLIQSTMPNSRLDTGIPIQILAAKDGKSFATIFPEYPYDKKRPQPEGLFLAGSEKNYIAMRANASGRMPFEDIYNNYARVALKLSYRNLPPWLDLGYQNAYGSISLTDRGAKLGQPDPLDLSALFESPLLPLDLVLHVDRSSPYYTSGNKITVYSAESRALTHYFLSQPQDSGAKLLGQYIAMVEEGADTLQAAKQSFGDLNQLQGRLESYIKQNASIQTEAITGGGSETGSGARTLSPAEIETRIANFELARGRIDDAQTKLEDAIMLDPSLAGAEEGLGFVLIRQQDLEEADMHFTRAIELDPGGPLAYYGRGTVAMSRSGFVGVPVGAIAAFEKTVSLAPDFAPAWYNLSSIYGQRKETLQRALEAAQRAASLVPGDSGYQYQLAVLLQGAGRTADARKVAEQLQKSSTDLAMADKAGDFIAHMSSSPTSTPPSSATVAKSAPGAERTLRIERKTEPDSKPAETVSNATHEASAPPPPPPLPPTPAVVKPAEPFVYSMVGKIAEVNCSDAPQMQITLKALNIVMRLHAADTAQLTVKSTGTTPVAKTAICTGLRGRTARVSYLIVQDKKWDGEIQTLELRNEM